MCIDPIGNPAWSQRSPMSQIKTELTPRHRGTRGNSSDISLREWWGLNTRLTRALIENDLSKWDSGSDRTQPNDERKTEGRKRKSRSVFSHTSWKWTEFENTSSTKISLPRNRQGSLQIKIQSLALLFSSPDPVRARDRQTRITDFVEQQFPGWFCFLGRRRAVRATNMAGGHKSKQFSEKEAH